LKAGAGASTPNYNRLNEWPLQFLRTGFYIRSYGFLNARTTHGLWWSATAGSATHGRFLDTYTGYVDAQSNSWRGHGFALREVGIIVNLHCTRKPALLLF
jgi:hypothetical protein